MAHRPGCWRRGCRLNRPGARRLTGRSSAWRQQRKPAAARLAIGVDSVRTDFHTHQSATNEFPKVKNILIRGLTEATHGNATGIGLAEFCTTRAIAQANIEATRINCLTGGHSPAAMMPLDYASDRGMIEAALPTIGMVEPANAKLIWIRNTLELREVECSRAYLNEARSRDDLEILCEPRPLLFDAAGNLPGDGVHAIEISAPAAV